MKLNLDAVLKNLKGESLKEKEGDKEKEITLRDVFMVSLLANTQEQLEGPEKVKRYKLAQRVNMAQGMLELSVEDIAKCKELVGKIYNTIVVGAAYDLIEGSGDKKDDTGETE